MMHKEKGNMVIYGQMEFWLRCSLLSNTSEGVQSIQRIKQIQLISLEDGSHKKRIII